MAHFYNCVDVASPSFEAEVTTPFQAKKAGARVYPSVTTVLGVVKDEFIDSIWKPSKLVELARQHDFMHWRDVEQLTYGTREHPMSGDVISSSEFGTTVHHCIEQWVNHLWLGQDAPEETPWDMWAMPFVSWIETNDVRPIACERLVACNRIKIAGSVDFIGHDAEGKLFLADYKCRTNTKGKAKTYPKDCEQLAIESFMLMKEHKLDYLPACRSIIIDCDTKEHHHREWTPEEMKWGIDNAKLCAKIYWQKRMNPVIK